MSYSNRDKKRTTATIKDIDPEKWRWFVGWCIQKNVTVAKGLESIIKKLQRKSK